MNVVIPSVIDGHTVTKLGGYLFNGLGFTAIEIPNTITSIGAYALANNNIKDVVIPDSVTSIDVYSFYNSEITNLTLSNSLTEISNYAFANNKISSLEIPASIKTIGHWSFSYNNIETVNFNEGLENIVRFSFLGNKISSLSLPSTLKDIGFGSFNDNQLPDEQAFIYKLNSDGTIDNTILASYGGAKRDNIVMPSQVKIIDKSAFQYSAINSIALNQGLKSIYNMSFSNNNLTSLTIPNSVNNIGEQAFIYNRNSDGSIDYSKIISYGGSNRSNINIPSKVNGINLTTLGNLAFYGCKLSGTINIPNTVTIIEKQSFLSNGFITSVVIPDSVISIGGFAFNNNSINSLILGNSLQLIDSNAFNHNNLSSITIPASVSSIGNNAFDVNPLTEVRIKGKSSPSDFTLYGTNIFGWKAGYSDANIIWNAS